MVAVGPVDVKLLHVKAGSKYLSALEREAIRALAVPANASIEVWKFRDRCTTPTIERL